MNVLKIAAFVLPLLILAASTSACGDNCRNLTTLELESGTWVSSSDMTDPPASEALHATGTQKRVTIDLETSTTTIAYVDAEGRDIVETWSMSEVYLD